MHDYRLSIAALCLAGAATAVLAQNAKTNAIPDFYQDGIGWVTRSNDFLPPKRGLGPVTDDPAHPYVMESRPGRPQTFRVADVNHPALMPWVKETLKKQNDQVLAGKPVYTVANSCRPAGVPNMLLVRITPFYFLQTPKEVWLIWKNTQTTVDNYHTPHTEKLHVIERFHMVESGKSMEVEVTVEDPGAFTQP